MHNNQLVTRNFGISDGASINIDSPSPVKTKSIFESNGKGVSNSGLKDQLSNFKRNSDMPSVIKLGRTDMITLSQTNGHARQREDPYQTKQNH